MEEKNFFKPNKFRWILYVILIIPIFLLIYGILNILISNGWRLLELNFTNTFTIIVLGVISTYLIGNCIDYFIKSKTVKIIIASILAVISIILAYFFTRINMMVCDPVHNPPGVYDPVPNPSG